MVTWPQFFNRPGRFTRVHTEMFRGLGLVTSDPSSSTQDEEIKPATGIACGDGSVRLNVSEHASNVASVIGIGRTGPATTVILKPVPNAYYVLRGVLVNFHVIAGGQGTSGPIAVDVCEFKGAAYNYIASVVMPNGVSTGPTSVADMQYSCNEHVPLNVACDVGYGVWISVVGYAAMDIGSYVNVFGYYDVIGQPNTEPFGPLV